MANRTSVVVKVAGAAVGERGHAVWVSGRAPHARVKCAAGGSQLRSPAHL